MIRQPSKSAVFFSLALALIIGLTGWQTNLAHAQKHPLPDLTQLAETNSKAVVNISTRRLHKTSEIQLPPQFRDLPEDWLRFFFNIPGGPDGGPQEQPNSLGSGFIVDSNGYIVTNHHVIDGADEVIVRLNDMRSLKAEVIGSDPRTDLALIKVSGKNLPAVKFGNSDDLKVGEWVVAIGSPFGFDYSVTSGIVSAKGRSLPNDAYVPFIQTDVAINPGNSGGPLFNLKGEVIGVNSQIYSRSGGFMGLSFAIPAKLIQFVIEQLREEGKVERGYLGVTIQEITSELSETFNMSFPHGALISSIIADSPAEKAGLEVGDVITHFNGKLIRRSYELPPIVGITGIDKRVPVIIQRDGKPRTIYAKIKELDETQLQQASNQRSNSGREFSRVGITVKELPDDYAEQINQGIYINTVERNGPADRAGIEAADVLLSLQGNETNSIRDLEKILENIEDSRRVRLLIWRDGRTLFTTLHLN